MAVQYCNINELVDAKSKSITAIFRTKSSLWSSGWHNGIDIGAPLGSPIKAAADGIVINTDGILKHDGFGNRVLIKHDDGRVTLYAHMVSVPIVKVNQSVKRGQVIGYVGGTGNTQNHYGAHLHFTMIDKYDQMPNIYYRGYLLDPIKEMGLGGIAFSNLVSNTILDADGKTKNLGSLQEYYAKYPLVTSTGSALKFHEHDVLYFTGGNVYISSTANKATKSISKISKVNVTNIAPLGTHQYHVVSVDNSNVYGWVDESVLTNLSAEVPVNGASPLPYRIKVNTSTLNIRKGPSIYYDKNGYISRNGVYTIVAESTGAGAKKWGKLKSGAGWIALDYTIKM